LIFKEQDIASAAVGVAAKGELAVKSPLLDVVLWENFGIQATIYDADLG
jgi:hypothetical protein